MDLCDLSDLVRDLGPPPPRAGDKIPWDDPEFSERMLAEHLSQRHDAASRRQPVVDAHVEWLHQQVLAERPSRVLDLCCGPGLYTTALARRGHDCTGFDFSPASIRHADACARDEALACRHELADVLGADFGSGHDLALLLFGEFNAFARDEARELLTKACAALAPGGRLVLEPHTLAGVRRTGKGAPLWYRSSGGLFSARPHLVLRESFWDEGARVATTRHFVIDPAAPALARYREGLQGYDDEEYAGLLSDTGFATVARHDALPGTPESQRPDLCVWVADRA